MAAANLNAIFSEFVKLSAPGKNLSAKELGMMNSKACGKMVKDCLPKEVQTIADASVFPKHKEKGQHLQKNLGDAVGSEHVHNLVSLSKNGGYGDRFVFNRFMCVEKFGLFIEDCAHEYAKIKKKNPKLPKDDPEVAKFTADFSEKLANGVPNVKTVKQSATGNVEGLTDHTAYTGTHKERFDADGKGKGLEGRENIHENKGYVGGYKGEGTYDKK